MTEPASVVTRPSLLEKLKNWDDAESWRRFYQTYWRLIFNFACKQGLTEDEAEEAVQETLIATARQLPGFRYDPARCAFKSWLLTLTQGKVADLLRRRGRRQAREVSLEALTPDTIRETAVADPSVVWAEEWRRHLFETASQKVRTRVAPEHWQVFDYLEVQGKSPAETAKATGYGAASAKVVCWRVRKLMREELRRLEREIL